MVSSMEKWLGLIKSAAVAAVQAADLLEIRYGTVTSESPLQISVDTKMPLEPAQLILTRNVTNHELEMSVNGGIKQRYTVFNQLKKDEKVIMLRMQGGGKYIVLDRV